MAKRDLCYRHQCQELARLPDHDRYLANDWRLVSENECEECQKERSETMNDAKLIEKLAKAAYDSGYYSGKGRDGEPYHLEAIEERGRLRDATLQRVANLRAALEALFTVIADVDTVYEGETGRTIEQDFVEELEQARAALAATEVRDV